MTEWKGSKMARPSLYDEDEIAALLGGLGPEGPGPVGPVVPPAENVSRGTSDLDALKALTEQKGPGIGERFRRFGLGAADAITGAYGGRSAFLPGAMEEERQKRSDAVQAFLTKRKMEQESAQEGREAGKFARETEAYETKKKTEAPLDDVASVQSQTLQGMAKRLDPAGDYSGLSARQLGPVLDDLRAGKKDEAELQLAKLRLETIKEERTSGREAKGKEKEETKKTLFNEIEDRRQNINSALDTLDTMIENKGTYETFGSHNQDLNRLIDQVATDMAKLQDPKSIARPGEVEMVKRTLVQAGVGTSNKTARQLLKNFKGEVERRANSAYTIRGYEPPAPSESLIPMARGTEGAPMSPKSAEDIDKMSKEELEAYIGR